MEGIKENFEKAKIKFLKMVSGFVERQYKEN